MFDTHLLIWYNIKNKLNRIYNVIRCGFMLWISLRLQEECYGPVSYTHLLEKGAHIYCIAHGFGTPFRLEEKQAKKLRDFYEEHYSKRQRGEE